MPTVLSPAPAFNFTAPEDTFDEGFGDYASRPSGHMDEGMIPPEENEIDAGELDRLHHEQAVDCGVDAIGDDLADAEAEVKSRFPGANFYASFQIHRFDERNHVCCNCNVICGNVNAIGKGKTLRDALDDMYNTAASEQAAA